MRRTPIRRQRIEIQQAIEGEDLDGIPEYRWQTLRTEKALMQPLTGREYELAQQMHSGTTHKIITRWFEGADSTMRIVRGDRRFNVATVINQHERNRWLEWRCEEVV